MQGTEKAAVCYKICLLDCSLHKISEVTKVSCFHGEEEGGGEEMTFEKVFLKQILKTFQEPDKVSRLQGQAYNTQGL